MPAEKRYRVYNRDMLDTLPLFEDGVFDSIVTDPPYGLSFMGKKWDHGVPGVPFWAECLRVLRPGGYMLAMGGSKTYHRLACAVEDAGFKYRDTLMWLYGSGFPKSKGCIKPAYEPIILTRKLGPKVLPLQIDACRVPHLSEADRASATPQGRATAKVGALAGKTQHDGGRSEFDRPDTSAGRWPANILHDGSDEVLEAFAVFGESKSKSGGLTTKALGRMNDDSWQAKDLPRTGHDHSGTVARFFYTAKASKKDRGLANKHPTVKPLALMRYLVKLVTPPDGWVLDPFMGSGTTGKACGLEGFRFCGIEEDTEHGYFDTAKARVREGYDRAQG